MARLPTIARMRDELEASEQGQSFFHSHPLIGAKIDGWAQKQSTRRQAVAFFLLLLDRRPEVFIFYFDRTGHGVLYLFVNAQTCLGGTVGQRCMVGASFFVKSLERKNKRNTKHESCAFEIQGRFLRILAEIECFYALPLDFKPQTDEVGLDGSLESPRLLRHIQ